LKIQFIQQRQQQNIAAEKSFKTLHPTTCKSGTKAPT